MNSELSLAIERYIEDHGPWLDFDGGYECEDCSGWDGRSHRCECGNRRLCWDGDVTPDGSVTVYPMTY